MRYHSTMNQHRPLSAGFAPYSGYRKQRAALRFFLCLTLAVPPPLLALPNSLPDLGESSRADLSPQLERKLGERIMNDIRQHEPTYVDDPEVNDYLNRIGHRLVAASSDPAGHFHFFAIRDSQVNAFAMFGGFIGVNTGTVLTSQSESELAGVMAHEVSHVTQHHLARQISGQRKQSVLGMIAMAVAVLAMRSNSQVAGAAMAGSEAAMVQSQLAFSRDFEREADRIGFDILRKADFDPRGMGDFFERLQKATRVYENNAPVYMRSHPVTVERISDMQNRLEQTPYRQVADSLDYQLVRARLRVQQLRAEEAIDEFALQLKERKFSSEAAALYGITYARLRAGKTAAAASDLKALRAHLQERDLASPMVESLAGAIITAGGDHAAAAAHYARALLAYPAAPALIYGRAEALLAVKAYRDLDAFLEKELAAPAGDPKLYEIQAQLFAAQDKKQKQHRALAEMYALRGQLLPAIEQLRMAQRAGGNFYEQSAIDSRLRELKTQLAEEEKENR